MTSQASAITSLYSNSMVVIHLFSSSLRLVINLVIFLSCIDPLKSPKVSLKFSDNFELGSFLMRVIGNIDAKSKNWYGQDRQRHSPIPSPKGHY